MSCHSRLKDYGCLKAGVCTLVSEAITMSRADSLVGGAAGQIILGLVPAHW